MKSNESSTSELCPLKQRNRIWQWTVISPWVFLMMFLCTLLGLANGNMITNLKCEGIECDDQSYYCESDRECSIECVDTDACDRTHIYGPENDKLSVEVANFAGGYLFIYAQLSCYLRVTINKASPYFIATVVLPRAGDVDILCDSAGGSNTGCNLLSLIDTLRVSDTTVSIECKDKWACHSMTYWGSGNGTRWTLNCRHSQACVHVQAHCTFDECRVNSYGANTFVRTHLKRSFHDSPCTLL